VAKTYARKALLRSYSLTSKEYDELLKGQRGLCAICKTPPSPNRPHLSVDHDHSTGAVRGLLCNHCNSGLGFMRDSIWRLREAILYLEAALE